MEASVSVSSFDADALEISVPRSTGELFRNLPGIRVESSSGDGNLNLTSRGLPISAGGAKYVQLQEDGLPVLQFGDISFATADQWLRQDYGTANIESVVGGAASTLATNAPGGIINFISNTGETAGGAVGVTEGLDYGLSRLDFGYGGPISNDTFFYVSGFYRYGEGQKTDDLTAFNGGQLKFNVTKKFSNGSFIRLYFKALDDRALSPLPVPMQIIYGLARRTGLQHADADWEEDWRRQLLDAACGRIVRQLRARNSQGSDLYVRQQRAVLQVARQHGVNPAAVYSADHWHTKQLIAKIVKLQEQLG